MYTVLTLCLPQLSLTISLPISKDLASEIRKWSRIPDLVQGKDDQLPGDRKAAAKSRSIALTVDSLVNPTVGFKIKCSEC